MCTCLLEDKFQHGGCRSTEKTSIAKRYKLDQHGFISYCFEQENEYSGFTYVFCDVFLDVTTCDIIVPQPKKTQQHFLHRSGMI